MAAIVIGVLVGIVCGLVYLFAAQREVRRTLASSVLLGVVVGTLIELARRPVFTAIFAGLATIFLVEFLRWVFGSSKRKS